MSVVIETTLGDITVDLFINDRPRACQNFLKLCKIKYYNYNLFHTISRGFIAQTGDPSGSRNGGESIYGVLDGPQKRFFEGENEPRIKHTKMGLISFVGNDDHMIGSQFFFTLGEDLTYLDENHCVFGEVVEGFDILEGINEVICDNDDRPYQDVRITHTVILDDPFPDPKKLVVPSRSPSPSAERLKGGRIAPDEEIDEMEGKTQAEVVEMQAEREAKARATILEMVGDLPDAEMAPPENVLFVCKLNPVTNDDDLEIIFSRFGKIKSCEVIRDKKTGDSLQYAFVEFEDKNACENAYFKMDNVLIDDRRIHVDFSQSVSKVKWSGKGRGVTHYDEKGRKSKHADSDIGKGNYKHKKNYENSEKRTNKMREMSRSPSRNKTHRTESYETERSLTPKENRSKNGKEYSRNSKHNDNRSNSRLEISPSREKRRKYSRSPTPSRDTYKLSNREKYTPTSRQRKYSHSPPRRIRDDRERSSSARYRKKPASPKRKKDKSPVSRRDRDNTEDKKRRSRSATPRRDSGKRNGNHEKSDRSYKNPSTSSRKSATEKKLYNKQRSVSSSEDSDSDSKSKYKSEKYNERRKKSTGKKSRESPERKRSDKDDKKKEKKKRKKRKDSSSSEDSGSDSDRELKKKAAHESESSDSDYKKRKSKKKKSKKSKHNDSSSDSDYKKKTKKKKKYKSNSD